MATSNKNAYYCHSKSSPILNYFAIIVLLVGSADMIAWVETLADEPRELYVEMRQDQVLLYVTKVVRRSENWSWNEGFVLYVYV
jgi:hypothetical protein